MPTIIVEKPFKFAEGGNDVRQYEAGEQEVSERCALVATEHLKVAKLKTQPKRTAKQDKAE